MTSVRSPASMATSVPVPMARPRSAWARAAASLTPSPTMATTRPSAWSATDRLDLALGQDLGDHVVDAHGAGDGAGRPLVVAGEQHGVRPSARSSAIAVGRRRLHGVGHDQHGPHLPVPAGQHGGAPLGRGLVAGGDQLVGQHQVGIEHVAAHGRRPRRARRRCPDAEARPCPRSRSTAGSAPSSASAAWAMARAMGCSLAASTAPTRRSASARSSADHVDQGHDARW